MQLNICMQVLVVSTPEGIGAGRVTEAAEEAEEHLQHGEPVPLSVPSKVHCHGCTLQEALTLFEPGDSMKQKCAKGPSLSTAKPASRP